MPYTESMIFYASMPSALGALLLSSDGAALSGLYFIGQKDCPNPAGFEPMRPDHFDPSAGEHEGRPIRTFKAVKNASHSSDLFETEPRAAAPALPVEEGPLAFMQEGTPAAVEQLFQQVRAEIIEYFQGRRRNFGTPLRPQGTAFQKKVWDALLEIPYGELVSYGDVARSAGLSAGHGRAVGAAVGRNPLSIIIPCHRVVSGSGLLTGYSGGLDRKLALLELEGFSLLPTS